MKKSKGVLVALTLVLITASNLVHGAEGNVRAHFSGTNILLKVDGDKDEDWWIEMSSDLVAWSRFTNFGTLLSGNETNAPWRAVGAVTETNCFYRAIKTAGLYDTTLLRTISLTFTQADWSNSLVQARANGTYVYSPLLTLDNGATNAGVGARFRGNTSFTGVGGGPGSPGGSGPVKKSLAISIDYTVTNANLMNYDSLNLNNAYGDETILREPVYFTIMRNYAVCPAGCLAQLYINGQNRGVYSQAQQEDGNLLKKYFPSSHGDRFRAANMDANAGFVYLGNTNQSTYTSHYELKSAYTTNAWPHLVHAIYAFNTLPTNTLRDTAEDVIAVDRWLWFLALENIFVDDDSYFNKGSDYILYYEPESGRVHPVEHDGNEAFTSAGSLNYSLSPVEGATPPSRPVLYRLLGNAELRQRYLAHLRTVIDEWFNPTNIIALIEQFHGVSVDAIANDPYRGYTSMATYTNDLKAIKLFVTNRYKFLTTHAELTPLSPNITAVTGPVTANLTDQPNITAAVSPNGGSGVDSVWLYYRSKAYGKFTYVQMFDDGAHGDGGVEDGVYGATITNYPAGTKVRYYVEARSANAAKSVRFSPARAEEETDSYRINLTTASNAPVLLNEFCASNKSTVADPQAEFDDWIELHNVTGSPMDLTGHYLSDEAGNSRKWQFPSGTTIAANGYLIVWADEDGSDSPGSHASFKLDDDGEQIYLIDTDANNNQVLDSITFGPQSADLSFGRSAADPEEWVLMTPTPGAANE